MASRRSQYYDEDDFDDGYDDDDWYGEEDEEYKPEPPPKAAPKPAPKPAGQAAKAAPQQPAIKPKPAAAAAKLPQAQAIRSQPHPLVPPAATAAATAAGVPWFQFDQPSPDDVVQQAQQGRSGGAGAAPARSSTAGAAPPTSSSSSSSNGGISAVTSGVQSLGVSQPEAAAGSSQAGSAPPGQAQQAQQRQQAQQQRPMSEYRMDPELAQECERAAAQDTQSGGKPKLHLVVLGHVDAGKSTLMGRMLFELGLVSDKAVHKTQRDAAAAGKGSFAWAWMLDERPEERARGVTVDVATTRFETAARNVTLLDAPGHRDFVPNMIAGAAQADAALLVVDGSPGGFEAGFEAAAVGTEGGGQTREHAQLARSLGVEQVAVVVTKLDTVGFDQQRFEHIRAVMLPFLKTCGFREAAIQWLPAAAPSGDNLVKPPSDPRLAAWWHGLTLAQAIDAFRPAHRLVEKPLRLPVADAQRAGKGGVAVGGKLEGGALRPGGRVLVMPARLEATVKAVEVDGQAATLARAGDGADVTLTGIEPSAVGPGSVLCPPGWPCPLAAKFEARVVVLDVAVPILRGQQVTLHAHTARESGHISALVSLLDPKSGEVARPRPRCLLRGQSAVVEVTPARPMCLEDYGDLRALGRVALRDGGRTVAVGIVTALTPAG